MDFFQQQDQARRKTKWLVIYFILAVVLLIAAVYFVALFAFVGVQLKQSQHFGYHAAPVHFSWWNFKVLLGATFGVLAVITLGSAYKINELSEGGSVVADLMGGRLISQDTEDPNERKLLNVVEEMSIASGVAMPQVYVMDRERGINAFAAGHSTGDAAITVTRGCLELLSRDELQGVIGHEFSHILNGDMKLNLRLIGIIFGLLCLATIGRILLYARGGSSRDRSNVFPLVGLALIVLGGIGVFFGRLIQAAVSRQREFLADASSVQFTRNPSGLSGALQKIGRYSYGSRLESAHAPDLCHMFFGNGLGEAAFGSMATHPPIPDRIHAIDPAWDGKFPPLEEEQKETVRNAAMLDFIQNQKRPSMAPSMNQIFGAVLTGTVAAGETPPPPVTRSEDVVPHLGNPTPLHLKYAQEMRDSMPENLRAAARNPLGASALIYALLLSRDEAHRAEQLAEIQRQAGEAVASNAASLLPDVTTVARRARLPLVNLAIGSLRNLTAEQFQQFSKTMDWLVNSDQKIELFEFVLQKIVLHHLTPKFSQKRPPNIQFYSIKPLVSDCSVILSALAYAGSDHDGDIEKAFITGVPFLRAPMSIRPALLPREQCDVKALNTALDRLAVAVPIIKKNLLEACARVVGADGVILETEAELLRAVADTLDCPMPPLGVTANKSETT